MWLVIIRIGSYEVHILQDGVGVVNASSYILYLYVLYVHLLFMGLIELACVSIVYN